MASLNQNDPTDDYRKLIALAMLKQGADTSPIQSPWQGAARLANALVGSMWGDQLRQEQNAADKLQFGTMRDLVEGNPTALPPMGNKVADAITQPTPYGSNMSGGVPLPPRNPLAALSPAMRERFPDLRAAAAAQGVEFNAPEAGSIGSVRTPDQQAALYAQGRSAPGPIVTGTLNSNHLTGNALDVVPTNGTTSSDVGKIVTLLTQNDPRFAGMRSGATFKNLYDPLHVEMNGPQVAQAAIPPGATPAQYSAPVPPPTTPQAATPAPSRFTLPPQIQDVIDNPQNYSPTEQRRARQIGIQLYQKQIEIQKAIEQHAGQKRFDLSPEIIRGEANKAGEISGAQERSKLAPDITQAQARAAGEKKQSELDVETSPQFATRRILEKGATAGAEEQAKLSAKTAHMKEQGAPAVAQALGVVNDTGSRALRKIENGKQWVAGWGSYLSYVPGASKDLKEDLETLKAQTSIDKLTQMRQASPTGAAVGNVTEGEHRLFAATEGSLDQMQNPEQLSYNIRRRLRVANAIGNPATTNPQEQMFNVEEAFVSEIPQKARDMLLASPNTAAKFDETFGSGTSAIVLKHGRR